MKKHIQLTMMLVLFICSMTATLQAADIATQLQTADQLFNTGEVANLERAKTILDQLVSVNSNNYEILWKTARCYEKLAPHTPSPLTIYEQGKIYADKAVLLEPNQVEGHYWVSALIGRIGEEKGILNSLFNVKPMKAELDRCVEIDPTFPDAYYVLGLLYWKVPGWPISIGDKKKAIEYARKAVNLAPEDFTFQWGLYQAYDASGLKKEATNILQQILQMPIAAGQEANAREYKPKAQAALN